MSDSGSDRQSDTESLPEIEVSIVLGTFQARPDSAAALAATLARYVILTRNSAHCRNVDLVASATDGDRFVVIEKWDGPDAARAHLDAAETVDMANAAVPMLASRPTIELYDPITAHDLR